MAEGGQSATGSLLQHVITTHSAYQAAKEAASSEGITVFEYLNNHLERLRIQRNSPSLTHLTRHFHRSYLPNCSNTKYIQISLGTDRLSPTQG